MLTTAVRDSLVDAARALRPTLLAHRDEAERLGHLHPKVVAAAGAAGMFRLTAPRRVGGLQLPLPAQHAVWEELARTDSTVAWCSWNCAPAGNVAHACGGLALVCGNGARARALLDAALATHLALGSTSWATFSRLRLAEALLAGPAGGDGERAGELAEAAAATAEARGLARLGRRAADPP
jgi:hypothetical protein